ncbi:hypothetical protein V1477_016806 [Vespula maculifrons]|uniref:Uncharacterized protein n=1 Tax=Vespula maculifrons TaxID=7453 RepID=A0ABD2B4A4_VESMC
MEVAGFHVPLPALSCDPDTKPDFTCHFQLCHVILIQTLLCGKIECFIKALNSEQETITYLELAGFHVPLPALSCDPDTKPDFTCHFQLCHVILIQILVCGKIECFSEALNFKQEIITKLEVARFHLCHVILIQTLLCGKIECFIKALNSERETITYLELAGFHLCHVILIQTLLCGKIECFIKALNSEQETITYLELAGFHVPLPALSCDPDTKPALNSERETITYLELAGFHVPSLALSCDPDTKPGLREN